MVAFLNRVRVIGYPSRTERERILDEDTPQKRDFTDKHRPQTLTKLIDPGKSLK